MFSAVSSVLGGGAKSVTPSSFFTPSIFFRTLAAYYQSNHQGETSQKTHIFVLERPARDCASNGCILDDQGQAAGCDRLDAAVWRPVWASSNLLYLVR